jgi:hypothetical protein
MQGREDISAFNAAFTGSHRYILDYLTEEVLAAVGRNTAVLDGIGCTQPPVRRLV